MKELYLIPKHQFEMMKSKNSLTSKNNDNTKSSVPKISNRSTSPKITRSNFTRLNKNKVLKSKSKVPDVGQKWGTRILPPPLQNPVYMKGINYNREDKPTNFNIEHQLTMKFYGKHLSHARVLLDHLEKSGNVEWNEYGDISHPINGYNVVNFLEDVIKKNKISPSKVEDYKFIISSGNIPLYIIKNKELKNYLTQDPPRTVIGKSGKLFNSKTSPQWNTY